MYRLVMGMHICTRASVDPIYIYRISKRGAISPSSRKSHGEGPGIEVGDADCGLCTHALHLPFKEKQRKERLKEGRPANIEEI